MSLAEMSISALCMILVITAVRFLLKGRLPWSAYVIMWYTVLIRLLVPFRISSIFSIGSLNKLTDIQVSNYDPPLLTASPKAENMMYINQPDIINKSFSMINTIWLVGMITLLIYFLAVFIRYRRNFKDTVQINNKLLDSELSRFNFARNVRLYKSKSALSPLTFGIIFPKILLPSDMDTEDGAALKYVMIHECIHIKRFDALTKLLMILALCIHWFNPFVWIMFSLLNKDLELSCDEAVIKITGEGSKTDYAMTLIRLEEEKSRRTNLIFNYFGKNIAEERIVAIMKKSKTSIIGIITASIVIITNTAVFATSPTERTSSENNVAPEKISEEINAPQEPIFIWPAEKCATITASFGTNPINGIFHGEIDISGDNAAGSEIVSSADGTVSEAGYTVPLGNYIVIDHGNGYETSYSHCQELYVKAGDSVRQGDLIATIGNTGMATGYFLGFSISKDDVKVDPALYLG